MPKSELSAQPPEENKVKTLVRSDHFKQAVAQVLPAHLTPDRFVRIAIGALTRTPRLAECDPNTVLQCMMSLSQFGLEPDGRNAHLIPFRNQRGSYDCTLIIDYKGLVDLAMRSGKIAFIHADKVCDNDIFVFDKGFVAKHEINFKEDRGKPYAYYAIARMKDGTEMANAMTTEEVQKIRKRSRAANDGPWVSDFDEMAKKTVFRRLSKWLPLSPEFRDALEADADTLEDLRFENAIPINKPKIERLKLAKGVSKNDAEGSAENLQPPKAVASPAKKKLRGIPSTEPKPPTIGVFEQKMIDRLASGNRTQADLVAVLFALNGIEQDQNWSDIGEDKFKVLLEDDNWSMIQAELEKK